MKQFLGVTAVVIMAVFLGCGKGNTQTGPVKAADFTLPSIDGKVITLSSLKGKKVLLDFFATWCPPCRRELAEINEIVKEYKDDTYEILCISVDDSLAKAKSYINKNGYQMTVLFDDKNIAQAYGVTGIPALFLVNEEGNIVWSQAGALNKERLIKLLELA